MTRGLLIAAPASGAGKTVVTMGLLRALYRRGVRVTPAKAGPDYIDPGFHAAAARRTSLTLDPWAMRAETVEALFRAIDDADERSILELSLQGFTATEISERLGRAERSVRRLRERVRKRLERMQAETE